MQLEFEFLPHVDALFDTRVKSISRCGVGAVGDCVVHPLIHSFQGQMFCLSIALCWAVRK